MTRTSGGTWTAAGQLSFAELRNVHRDLSQRHPARDRFALEAQTFPRYRHMGKRDDSDAQIRRSSNATVRSPAEVAVVPEISG